jgi:hypothetical protein
VRKTIALALITPALLVGTPLAAHAGGSTDAALALGSFAVLNQLIRGETVLHDLFGGRRAIVRETVVVHQPPVFYAPPSRVVHAPRVIYAPPPAVVYAPARLHRFVPPGHLKRSHFHPGHRHGHHSRARR